MANPIPMQEMNDVPEEPQLAPEEEPQAQIEQPQAEQPQAPQRQMLRPQPQRRFSVDEAAGYFGPDEDRMDRAAADLDAAIQQIGEDPTVDQLFQAAEIQALISIAGELRSIREAGISQGDVL